MNIPELVDYHCHVDLYPDYVNQFARCQEQRKITLAVTTTPRAWRRNVELARNAPLIRVALGLHPQLVAEFPNDLSTFREHLPEARFVGEVGIDKSPRFYQSYDQQKETFDEVLALCSKAGGKILSVHSVWATRDVLDSITSILPADKGRVVLHWFAGTFAEVGRAIELGCYFSINAEMLKKQKQRALVERIPLDRILTETDGPFTGLQPGEVTKCTEELGILHRINPIEVNRRVLENVRILESF